MEPDTPQKHSRPRNQKAAEEEAAKKEEDLLFEVLRRRSRRRDRHLQTGRTTASSERRWYLYKE
jgi:hypothetical protein